MLKEINSSSFVSCQNIRTSNVKIRRVTSKKVASSSNFFQNYFKKMVQATEIQIKSIGNVLNDPSRPLKERFRALFTLKNIGGETSIECIKSCFNDPSVLLKHELAYCLGQMQDERANSVLIDVLEDPAQEAMVRHEAAEALGAIGTESNLTILEKYKNDKVTEVAETCQLALQRINWLHNNQNQNTKSPYYSIDPAPPSTSTSIDDLKNVLLSDESTLFERYKAMFALRNLKATEALGEALSCGSALFKHEVAFVLGQLQDVKGASYLIKSLEDKSENEMVRHECAEALGAIATDECMGVLKEFLEDEKRVVRESCEVALDMCEYENSPEFQYADTLNKC